MTRVNPHAREVFSGRTGWENTDPRLFLDPAKNKGPKDSYIPPDADGAPREKPLGFVSRFLKKRSILQEAKESIAKIPRLLQAPDDVIRYFFDRDLPKLVAASRIHPNQMQRQLEKIIETAQNREALEPWVRLVQVACGDSDAFLKAMDLLG